MLQRMFNLYSVYRQEMEAYNSWSGHEYAAQYLLDLWCDLRRLFDDLKKDAHFSSVSYNIELAQTFLLEDYNELIDKVSVSMVFSSHERGLICESLNNKFIHDLDVVIDLLCQIYRLETGNDLSDLYEGFV